MSEGVPEVQTDSDHEFHRDLYRALVLLAIDAVNGPVYFVVEGLGAYSESARDLQEQKQYFYEEHTCPTNFVGSHSPGYGVVALYVDGDRDPHGVFRFVRAVWMPQRYVDACAIENERGHNIGLCKEDVLEDLFPELTAGHPRKCTHQGRTAARDDGSFSMSIGVNGDTSMMDASGDYTWVHYVYPGEVCNHPDRIQVSEGGE